MANGLWQCKKALRRYVGLIGVLLIIGGCVVIMDLSPRFISAASASSRTANPTPTQQLAPWDGDPQKFANAARASLDETWRILTSYSHGMASSAQLPRIVVVDNATRTNCKLSDPNSPATFDPITTFADICVNAKAFYLSRPQAITYVEKFGQYALLAYLAEQLIAFKADQRQNLDGFTACVTGAWLGYLRNDHWQFIEQQVVSGVQSYFSDDDRRKWFLVGQSKRSLDPCLAI